MSNLKPEDQVVWNLGNWFRANGIDIWVDKKTTGLPTFNVKGIGDNPSTEKGDILIKFMDYKGEKQFALIEVKKASSSNLSASSKIRNYLQNVYEGRTQYLIDNKNINPKYFLVATENSPHGHLLNEDREPIDRETERVGDKREWRKYGIPRYEWPYSKRFCREVSNPIWWKPIDGYHLGSLLSTKNIDINVDFPKPLLFTKTKINKQKQINKSQYTEEILPFI